MFHQIIKWWLWVLLQVNVETIWLNAYNTGIPTPKSFKLSAGVLLCIWDLHLILHASGHIDAEDIGIISLYKKKILQ